MKAIPSSLRAINQRLLLERLLRDGTATRAELADRTGMSRPTAGKILDELLQGNVVELVDAVTVDGARPLGRPGQPLRLQTKTPRFALVQVGVTHTNVQWAPVAGAPDETPHASFLTPDTGAQWIAHIRTLVTQEAPKGLWGVVVSLPGVVDEQQGRSVFSPNLRWAPQFEWMQALGRAFGKPVCVVQEIRALALGHMQQRPEERDFLLIDSGEGVGAAVVLNGKLFHGASAVVAEIGHAPVFGQTRQCGCGATGCLETLLSTQGLASSWRQANKDTRGKNVAGALVLDQPPPWLASTLDAAAQNVAAALNLFGIRQVVASGILAELSEGGLQYMRQRIRQGALPARFSNVEVQGAPRKRFRGLSAAAVDRLLNLS